MHNITSDWLSNFAHTCFQASEADFMMTSSCRYRDEMSDLVCSLGSIDSSNLLLLSSDSGAVERICMYINFW